MLYLFLSVCCSLAVAAIFKYNESKEWDRIVLLTANYWVAAIVALVVRWAAPIETFAETGPKSGFWILALITGSLFISTYFILAWATNVAGMGLATGVMRVSVVVPVIASWILWNEQPSAGQMIGLALAGVAFFCIAWRREPSVGPALRKSSSFQPAAVFFVLLLLFVSGGVVDTCIKVFDEVFASAYPETFFLIIVYLVAAGIGTGVTMWNYLDDLGGLPARVLTWGGLLGICNYGATLFFLWAVAQLAAPFVFPANSIAIVLGAALIGVYAWGEKLSRLNWIGLTLAAIALVLLRM